MVSVPKYTVAFNLNGAPGAAPASRKVFEGKPVGELPTATWSGHTFVGWFVGDTQISEATSVTADMVCTARWESVDIIFWKPTDMTWKDTMFVNSSSSANEMQSTFRVGDPIYFYYACYEADGQTVRTAFVNRFTLIGDNGVAITDLYHEISGISTGTCRGVYGEKVDAFQNLAAGTYTLTCTLDADENVLESNEGNNTKSITFTVVPDGTTIHTVTFNPNGGTVSPATRQVASGAAVGTLPTATWSGHTLVGWFTSANGGTQISASTKVTSDVTYYAHWTANGGGGSGGGEEPGTGDSMPVVIIINNITINVTVIVGEVWGSNLPTPEVIPGMRFVGWFTAANGMGTRVTSSTVVTAGMKKLYAYYVAEEDYYLYDPVVGAVSGTAASTYDGYLRDASGNVKGTIQVKVGKPNAKTGLAAVKATVVGLDGKKKSLKAAAKGKVAIAANGPTTVSLAGGEACEMILGTKGLSGTYGNYTIDGALNVFTSKDAADKAVASAVLGKWQGAVNVAWRLAGDGSPYQTLSVTIVAKGKAKVTGTLADGTKVSAKGQLIVGEEWCCVPVVVPKKAQLAFNVWLPRNGAAAGTAAPHTADPVVVGLGADVKVGKPGTLKGGATFRLGAAMGDAKYDAYLPDGLAVTGGAKWTLPKAGKVQLAKDGTVDASKLGENPSALKLTYKAKDGSFKGSFKAYADVGGKPKGTTVKVMGVLVNGVGYGMATAKDVRAPVTIE